MHIIWNHHFSPFQVYNSGRWVHSRCCAVPSTAWWQGTSITPEGSPLHRKQSLAVLKQICFSINFWGSDINGFCFNYFKRLCWEFMRYIWLDHLGLIWQLCWSFNAEMIWNQKSFCSRKRTLTRFWTWTGYRDHFKGKILTCGVGSLFRWFSITFSTFLFGSVFLMFVFGSPVFTCTKIL